MNVWIKRALEYMDEHYYEDLKLQDVALKVYVSQWYLSKLLNRSEKKTFSDILNHIRIEKAKELLKEPDLKIGDVSDMVGFGHVSYFSKVFKKETGISAREYRNEIRF